MQSESYSCFLPISVDYDICRNDGSCLIGKYVVSVLSVPVCLQDDPIGNLNTAFEVAEKFLDIPKMLDAEGEAVKLSSEIRITNLLRELVSVELVQTH